MSFLRATLRRKDTRAVVFTRGVGVGGSAWESQPELNTKTC